MMKTLVGTFCAVFLCFRVTVAVAQCCGDCDDDGTVTVNELISAVNNALSGCSIVGPPGVCALLRTGQQESYQEGDDGDLRAGVPLRYIDNGDGTITDSNTGLMWEKKGDGQDCLNCVDDTYPWTSALSDWIERVNGRIGHCALRDDVVCRRDADCPPTPAPFPPDFCVFPAAFAGYDDWRLPNLRELQTLIDYGRKDPSVDPIFHSECRRGCAAQACSCTSNASSGYWSSTTAAGNSSLAWFISFDFGGSGGVSKTSVRRVRAVRGGPVSP